MFVGSSSETLRACEITGGSVCSTGLTHCLKLSPRLSQHTDCCHCCAVVTVTSLLLWILLAIIVAAAAAAPPPTQRMEWGAWVAWTRVVLEAALAQSWPQKEPLEVLSKGLVGGQ